MQLLRKLFPYPVPYVVKITRTGYVKVRFSRDLVFESGLGLDSAETKL